jgi:putative ABC transport system permease protein
MSPLLYNLRYAWRQTRNAPGVAITILLMLALGVGVNTAIFFTAYQVLYRPMPVERPQELVLLKESSAFDAGELNAWDGNEQLFFSYPAYQALRDGNHVLAGLAASAVVPATLVSSKGADRTLMQLVTGNYFGVLGVRPLAGRLIAPSDDREHAGSAVVVLNDRYWHDHFGGDPSILNRQVQINGSPFTVLGIASHEGLIDSAPCAMFIPISMVNAVIPGAKSTAGNEQLVNRNVNLIGRLLPTVGRMETEAQLNTLWWNWRYDVLQRNQNLITDETGWLKTHLSVIDGGRGIPLLQDVFGEKLRVLQAMAFVVLLVACGNMANLLLARAARQRAQLAVQMALGSGRRNIFLQAMCYGLILGVIGAGTGVLLGSGALVTARHILPPSNLMPQPPILEWNWFAILLCASLGIVASLVFSLAATVFGLRINIVAALRQDGRSVLGSGMKLRNLLVSFEIALSFFLLSCTTVYVWSLHQLQSTDLGYDHSGDLLTFRVNASILGKNDEQVKNEYSEIVRRIGQLPGVIHVAYSAQGLLEGSERSSDINLPGYRGNDETTTDENWVTPEFFMTLNVPLRAGRGFTEQDTALAPKVAVVDQAFVKRYFGGDVDMALRGQFGLGDRQIQIVGIVPAIRATSIVRPPALPFLYLPYDQTYSASGFHAPVHPASFYIHTAGNAASISSSIAAIVHEIDLDLPILRLETMEDRVGDLEFETRLATRLAMLMGGLALLLAAIGLYSTLAFAVLQRTSEIGVRMALGADHIRIMELIAKQTTWVLVCGTALGISLSWWGVRYLVSRDVLLRTAPVALFLVPFLLLLLTMILAIFVPARRASKLDPLVALRCE